MNFQSFAHRVSKTVDKLSVYNCTLLYSLDSKYELVSQIYSTYDLFSTYL